MWKRRGKVRFTAYGKFVRTHSQQVIAKAFECDPLSFPDEANWAELLCRHKLSRPEFPDFFLVYVGSSTHGLIESGARLLIGRRWSPLAERNGATQETLLVMKAHSWFRTSDGLFVFQLRPDKPWQGSIIQIPKQVWRFRAEI